MQSQTSSTNSIDTLQSHDRDVADINVVDSSVTIPTKNYHQALVQKIVSFCFKNKLVLFGSFVREHLCSRPFDPEASDLDIFSHKMDAFTFTSKMGKIGINTCRVNGTVPKYMTCGDFAVHSFVLRMANDEFFLGRKIEVRVDFVKADHVRIFPPFNSLDFECNAFIFDRRGIRLSRYT